MRVRDAMREAFLFSPAAAQSRRSEARMPSADAHTAASAAQRAGRAGAFLKSSAQ